MSGLYTRFVSGVAFPLHEWLKGHASVRLRRSLERTQWLDPEGIERLRIERLRAFLESVSRDVPYYRELFARAGVHPGEVRSLADLARIPLLDKALIRRYAERMKSGRAGRLARFNTGGSSGEPLVFWLGERVARDVAAKWRATRWWDVDIGDREVVLWGSPIELGSQDLVKSLRDRLLRSTLLSAFDLSDLRVDRYIDIIARLRPAMLFGYPSVIALIAQRARELGRDLSGTGVRVAFVTAERLYDWQKTVIEEVFACRVANGYGGRDAGFIAHECPAGGMHITAEDVIVEILDDRGEVAPAGALGEIVVTHMGTPDFPFVRYRTGDVGSLDDRRCPCGRGLPLLGPVEGRTTDFIVTSSGKRLHGLSLIYVLREQPGIASFRIVQERPEAVEVLIVPGPSYAPQTADAIRDGIVRRMDPDTAVAITLVDRLPEVASGKHRYVISKVPSGWGA